MRSCLQRSGSWLLVALLCGISSRLAAQIEIFVSYQDSLDSNSGHIGSYALDGSPINSNLHALDGVTGLAMGSGGVLYAGATASLDFDGASGILRIDASNGSSPGTFISYNGGHSELVSPGGMAFDSSGNLYVSEGNSQTIKVYSPAGTLVDTLDSADPVLTNPDAIAFGAADRLYVTAGADVLSCFGGSFTTVNSSSGAFSNITLGGLTLASNGDLYIVATSGLYQLDPDTGASAQLQDFTSSAFTPSGIASDGDYLYVTGTSLGGLPDYEGHGLVWRYDLDGTPDALPLVDLGFGINPSYIAIAAIPEPATWALFAGSSLSAVVFFVRRRAVRTLS